MSNVFDTADLVWQCPCGCADFYLRKDGRITCQACSSGNNQLWLWKEANDDKLKTSG